MPKYVLGETMQKISFLTSFVSELINDVAVNTSDRAVKIISLLCDFREKISGFKGDCWIWAFKLFLKKENPFPRHQCEDEPTWLVSDCLECQRILSEASSEIDVLFRSLEFDTAPCRKAFNAAIVNNEFVTQELVAIREEEMWLDPSERIELDKIKAWGMLRGYEPCLFGSFVWFIAKHFIVKPRTLRATFVFVSASQEPFFVLGGPREVRDHYGSVSLFPDCRRDEERYFVFAKPQKASD